VDEEESDCSDERIKNLGEQKETRASIKKSNSDASKKKGKRQQIRSNNIQGGADPQFAALLTMMQPVPIADQIALLRGAKAIIEDEMDERREKRKSAREEESRRNYHGVFNN